MSLLIAVNRRKPSRVFGFLIKNSNIWVTNEQEPNPYHFYYYRSDYFAPVRNGIVV